MEIVSGREMLDSVCRGFEKALCRTDAIVEKHPKSAAARLSSKFVYEVASAVRCRLFPDHCLKVIRVKDDGTKDSGEWLVDACVSEENDGFTERIVFAMESESATGKKGIRRGLREARPSQRVGEALPRHLRTIRLFEFRGHFVEVRASNAA